MCVFDVNDIVAALSVVRAWAMPNEYDIHALIDKALTDAGIDHVHEKKLAPRCRIDFLCGSVGVEIKKGRPVPSKLRSQVERYLSSDELTSIIVVMQKGVNLPDEILGKGVYLVSLNRLWGVALP